MEVEIGFNKLTSTSTSVSRDRACRVSGGFEVAPDFHGLPMHPRTSASDGMEEM